MPVRNISCAGSCAVGRSHFLRSTALATLAGITGAGLLADPAFAQGVGSIAPAQSHGKILTYTIPAREGALFDADNGVIVARVRNTVYALSVICPHRAVQTLEWLPDSREFHCPKHDAHFQPDGGLIDGRPDRAMDRFAVRAAGPTIVVDTATVFQADVAHESWTRAAVTVGR
jgi:nitrite reductase/ring-hydroxylating ferredoxin subunit